MSLSWLGAPEEELEGLELGFVFVFVLRVEFVVGLGVEFVVGLGVAVGTVLDAAAAVCAEA